MGECASILLSVLRTFRWSKPPGILVKWVAFLGTLHWPTGGLDLGVGGFSYV